MTIRYLGLDGEWYTEELRPIEVPGIVLHATPDENVENIRRQGLLTNRPRTKQLTDIPAIFCTIPSDPPTTADLFRYYADWSIVVIDTSLLPNHQWYLDFLAQEDSSNNGHNQHVLTMENIPPEAIRKIVK